MRCRRASTEADAALREPVEGTILTVARALAEGAEAAASDDVIATVEAALAAAEAALARTPGAAPGAAPRPASSTPAGRASSSSCAARSPRCAAIPIAEVAPVVAASHEPIAADYDGPRYCTGFLVSGSFPRELLERRLAALGDCLVVVSDGELVRAHLHTDDPGRALSAATTLGALSGVEISDMHAQRDALLAPRQAPPLAPLDDDGRLADILAVVDGDGNRVLYASLGARLLAGRPPDGLRARRRHAREPGRGHRRCCPTRPSCRSSPSTPPGMRTCRCTSCRRAGSRRASQRSSPTAPTSRPPCSPRRSPRPRPGPAAPRSPGGDGDDAAALRDAVGRALAPGSTLVTVLAGAEAEEAALAALARLARGRPTPASSSSCTPEARRTRATP